MPYPRKFRPCDNVIRILQAYLFGDILSRHWIVARYHHHPDPCVVTFLHCQRYALAYRVSQAQQAYKFKIEIVLRRRKLLFIK